MSRQSSFDAFAVPTHLRPGACDDENGNESNPDHMTSYKLTLLTKEQRPCHGDGPGIRPDRLQPSAARHNFRSPSCEIGSHFPTAASPVFISKTSERFEGNILASAIVDFGALSWSRQGSSD
jgi:hypothetical protein